MDARLEASQERDGARMRYLFMLLCCACGFEKLPHRYEMGCLSFESENDAMRPEVLTENFDLLVEVSAAQGLFRDGQELCSAFSGLNIKVYDSDTVLDGASGLYESRTDTILLPRN